MRVRFWGACGSIPATPTTADIRRKLEKALITTLERNAHAPEDVCAFLEDKLASSISHTCDGHSPCVEIDDGSGRS